MNVPVKLLPIAIFLLLAPYGLREQTGALSPDHRWKIEISQSHDRDPATGLTSPPHVRLILHDLSTRHDKLVWDKTGDWLPNPADAAWAIWRFDSRAFTLPAIARKFRGFSVYMREPDKWVRASQSNDFLEKIEPLWKLSHPKFNAAQQGGVVTDLRWDNNGKLHFDFQSPGQIKTRVEEELVDKDGTPQVVYVAGRRAASGD